MGAEKEEQREDYIKQLEKRLLQQHRSLNSLRAAASPRVDLRPPSPPFQAGPSSSAPGRPPAGESRAKHSAQTAKYDGPVGSTKVSASDHNIAPPQRHDGPASTSRSSRVSNRSSHTPQRTSSTAPHIRISLREHAASSPQEPALDAFPPAALPSSGGVADDAAADCVAEPSTSALHQDKLQVAERTLLPPALAQAGSSSNETAADIQRGTPLGKVAVNSTCKQCTRRGEGDRSLALWGDRWDFIRCMYFFISLGLRRGRRVVHGISLP
ncbi:hypothetical protein CYMTET_14260 [Cymbomonas tetramitiformis]|uniref:Uncharacterized protein n=1 Tax=Cymbomonas tetramitiformis TaxID=36881 RepID=A0AAE0GGN6_9CHLO|nr:hypothetical protein CYMTET_14260 [Cymbomonas tetramitiformis]